MTFGSLFAGIGGMDLGLERAGMMCRWQVEIDPFCQKVLNKHWPDVPKYGDIRQLTGEELESVDLIAGGFPCQPFSSCSAGKAKGTADARFLWPEMLRIIRHIRPAWVIGENVTHIERYALSQVVSDLEDSGYEVAPPLEVPACAFGHDHRRSRIWIIGHTNSNRKSGLSEYAETPRMPGDSSVSSNLGIKNGFSRRLDRSRLRALGNAVVPDIPEWIGRHILQLPTVK